MSDRALLNVSVGGYINNVCVAEGTCEYELIELVASLRFDFTAEMFAIPLLLNWPH